MIYVGLFLYFCWLYGWGGRNDSFKRGDLDWLSRHKPGWALRDWLVGFVHVILIPELGQEVGWVLIPIQTIALVFYWVFFNFGYGFETAKKIKGALGWLYAPVYGYEMIQNTIKPVWWIWRAWQLLGVWVGLIVLGVRFYFGGL